MTKSDSGFEIKHLSFRKFRSSPDYGGPVDYYLGNIVFSVSEPTLKDYLKLALQENVQIRGFSTEEQLLESEEIFSKQFDEWLKGDDLVISSFSHRDLETSIYTKNTNSLNSFLVYIEKFDCYQFREYFQDNPVVRGCIQYLQDMKDSKPNPTRVVEYDQFYAVLNTLTYWWD